MSIDILYFPQKRFHIGCILMKLRYQSFNPIELQLRTEIFYKREPDKFIVNIGMKMEDIHFYRTFGTIPYRGTSTDIEHTIISMPVERDMNCIDTIGRNQLYEFLRENKYVYKKGETDRNFPTRRSTKMRILETRYPSSTTEFGPTVYVTPKGIKYFLRRRGMIEAFIERQKTKATKKINRYNRR
jgi:phage antirepressor YoqD-like protein